MFRNKKIIILSIVAGIMVIGSVFAYLFSGASSTLTQTLPHNTAIGTALAQDLAHIPATALIKNDNGYGVQDDLKEGIQITYADQENGEDPQEPQFAINFPKDYKTPIDIKLDNERIIQIADKTDEQFTQHALTGDQLMDAEGKKIKDVKPEEQYIAYTNDRKILYYAYQKDHAFNERKLKHWTVYNVQDKQNTEEKESYTFTNAKITKNIQGQVEVRYYGDQNVKNEQVMADVEPSLLERAQKTIAKETGGDIMNTNSQPDFIIPEPYYIDKDGNKTTLIWDVNEESNEISLAFTADKESYPLALDPTLQFSAPGQANGGDVITGEASGRFGASFAVADLNADGKDDLVVGSMSNNKVYIFYYSATLQLNAVSADVIITGDASSNFGRTIILADINNDDVDDLVVGAYTHTISVGRVYIFYNDGSIPTAVANADVTIAGGAGGNYFGWSITAGDFNADNRTDIAVGAYGYATNTGRVYIFYNDGSIPTTTAAADVIITGETTSNYFGYDVSTYDYNHDHKDDLLVGAYGYSSNAGRVYAFYNDGSYVATAAGADSIITGEGGYFGVYIQHGDLNADGTMDLIVGANGILGNAGRVYIFYNDGSIPTTAATADASITGEATSNLIGQRGTIAVADLNADGRDDLVIGAYGYTASVGRVYILYNDGDYPTNVATADVIITGEVSNSSFGWTVASGDVNADGKDDLIVGAYTYGAYTGRAYIFYTHEGQAGVTYSVEKDALNNYLGYGAVFATGDLDNDGTKDLIVSSRAYGEGGSVGRVYIFYNDGSITPNVAQADVIITGEASSYFGAYTIVGDLNDDGKDDLVVGAYAANGGFGRVYIFYNDGSYPTMALGADMVINGEIASSYFGWDLAIGDLNNDHKNDLIIGALQYSANRGRVYVFYQDGNALPIRAADADLIIDGEADSLFGVSVLIADLDDDGDDDLAVGASKYNTYTGRAYIFYNDGAISTSADTADVIITGETINNYFGYTLQTLDINADGTKDLVVGAYNYLNGTGRVYGFYSDGMIPAQASDADLIITGESTVDYFGVTMAAGDFNDDGRDDLIVGANGYGSTQGRVYIFYVDGTSPTQANNADTIITGTRAYDAFGNSLATSDFNSDGKADLVVSAYVASFGDGAVHIFYNDGTLPTSAASSDLLVSGEETSVFGTTLAVGDLNNDNKDDLIVGAFRYDEHKGRVYIFYNTNTVDTVADVVIEASTDFAYFGVSFATGDFNDDGTIDLAVGAYNTSKVYIFYNDGSFPITDTDADLIITGSGGTGFGISLVDGDFDDDGTTDLAVGAYTYNTSRGAVYIFYNDGSMPNTVATADETITGEASSYFGYSLVRGDLNNDSKTDLVVGAQGYGGNVGRVYIFYNDGDYPGTADVADVVITGEAVNYFGRSLAVGDLNNDGIDDLVMGTWTSVADQAKVYIFYGDGTNNFGTAVCSGANPTVCSATNADQSISGQVSTYFGGVVAIGDLDADGDDDLIVSAHSAARIYVFYNDGTYPTTSTSADLTITGPNAFGVPVAVGDFNVDGRTDIVVGAHNYNNSYIGAAYIFYNDGTYPTNSTVADVTFKGEETRHNFAMNLISGDVNGDGKTDLIVGSPGSVSYTGRTYIFYNDGTVPTSADKADVIIVGEKPNNNFGSTLALGDMNDDGTDDLIIGAYQYDDFAGRVYIFYSDGSIPTSAASADHIIDGSDYFGWALTTGDFDNDGTTDLTVGANNYAGLTGQSYIFYNDGSMPTTAASADAVITGEGVNNSFGQSMITSDFDGNGTDDLIISAYQYNSFTGRVYVFYNDGTYPALASGADKIITGEATSSSFGQSIVTADFDADGTEDLIISAYRYNTFTGRVYIFYNDGTLPTNANAANVTITGDALSYFGYPLSTGDYNGDSKIDLVVGSMGSNSYAGRACIFYNDGTIPITATAADVIFTGTKVRDYFGYGLASGDFNGDRKIDIAAGSYGANNTLGKFDVFTIDAAYSKPDYVEIKGGYRTQGTVTIQ